MEVFELTYPGAWLDMPNEREVQALLMQLESQLADASVGLAFFEEVSTRPFRTAGRSHADYQVRRAEWANGHMPQEYEHRVPFVYAHTVIYALDAIGKTINVLVEMGISPNITTARDTYESAIPHLKAVRDSAHHVEDRARGVHHGSKPISLQPINNGIIVAPSGALALSNLFNNKLGYTAQDGHYREIEINRSVVKAAQSAIQQVLDALTWRGPSRTVPR